MDCRASLAMTGKVLAMTLSFHVNVEGAASTYSPIDSRMSQLE